jgi:hypothetical protein
MREHRFGDDAIDDGQCAVWMLGAVIYPYFLGFLVKIVLGGCIYCGKMLSLWVKEE